MCCNINFCFFSDVVLQNKKIFYHGPNLCQFTETEKPACKTLLQIPCKWRVPDKKIKKEKIDVEHRHLPVNTTN